MRKLVSAALLALTALLRSRKTPRRRAPPTAASRPI